MAMPKKQLSEDEIQAANSILDDVRVRLAELSKGDPELLFALRRRVYIRLQYDERGTPQHRNKLKNQKWKEQRGKCAICHDDLPEIGAELDRFDAAAGYTKENTQLIHHECHRKQQAERGYR
jgi:hypothetical protein